MIETYKNKSNEINYFILIAVLLGLVLILFTSSIFLGTTSISLKKTLSAILALEGLYLTIIIELRLPRAILALFMGAALGISGAALQGL